MPKKKKETSFENDLERLEELVNKMESGDATLEQSLVWFEQGMDLTDPARTIEGNKN